MPRNLVLLSDGTGNSAAKLFKTNVWRLYGALDLRDPGRQIGHYADGVGTSSFKPLAILGGIFGFGLKRNVLDLYLFACRSYRPGDHIFGFGFSRGAFTIRIVAGFIGRVGLVPYHGNEAQLERDALAAYRVYRGRFKETIGLVTPLRRLRDVIARWWRALRRLPQFDPDAQIRVDRIRFLGVWDTVAAYGGPIEEITRGIDYWIWPLSMPDRFLSWKVQRACHAVALDDERNAFWPVLWDEQHVSGPAGLQPIMDGWERPAIPGLAEVDEGRLSQVWFAGMHSDVGGGYAQDGLAHVALDWMMDRAAVYGLLFKADERKRLGDLASDFDKRNDSRHGLGGYYRYKPRKLVDVYRLDPVKPAIARDLGRAMRTVRAAARPGAASPTGPESAASPPDPLIHDSVFRRLTARLDDYSPIVLPEAYRVTNKAGDVRSGLYEHPSQATTRNRGQETAWNWVWLRRVVYFATVFASLFVAALPLVVMRWGGPGEASRAAFLIPLIGVVRAFLPGLAAPWLDAFQTTPGLFAVGVAVVGGLLLWGGALQRRIGDVMLGIWHPAVGRPPHPVTPGPMPTSSLYRLRTSRLYRGFFYALTRWILPTFFAAFIVCGGLIGAVWLLAAVTESLGG
ncbi:MAG: DUF2235 domain-containing protein [Candidatus Rokuibacteriota bacterium]